MIQTQYFSHAKKKFTTKSLTFDIAEYIITIMVNKLNQKHILKQKLRQYLKIRTAAILQLRENEYAQLVNGIENNPIFQRLLNEYRILSLSKHGDARLSYRFCNLIENTSPDNCPPEVDSTIEESKKAVSVIKKLGIEKFEKYFLHNYGKIPMAQVCRECGISQREGQEINGLLNSLAVFEEFYNPSGLSNGFNKYFSKIAKIENYNGTLQIHFFSPHYARDKYLVDYDRLKELKDKAEFSGEQLKVVNALLSDIEAVNEKKSTIYEIIKYILRVQYRYFSEEDEEKLVCCTQKEAAGQLGIDESVFSRAVDGRSIETPAGAEKTLRYFFQNRKQVLSRKVKAIINESAAKLTDNEITKILNIRHNIRASRRAVNLYRNFHPADHEKK